MFECFSFADAHHFGDALPQMFRLRQRVFIDRQGYQVPSWQGMEFDQYDTPATLYGLWRDDRGIGRGIVRLSPTTLPYMIEDVWPDMVTAMPLPKSPTIWEATRGGIDQELPKSVRNRIAAEMALAYQEMGLMVGAASLIAVTEPWVMERLFTKQGWPVQVIGPVTDHDGWTIVPMLMPVSPAILASIRNTTGIHHPVLQTARDRNALRMAAE